jgi:hypothetical protein
MESSSAINRLRIIITISGLLSQAGVAGGTAQHIR